MLDKAECYLHETFNVGHRANFKDKLIVNLHLLFPVRLISRGIVIGIALTRNQSPFDVKTLSSLRKCDCVMQLATCYCRDALM